jgi:branched-chain amino acid transport system substrate-binding protein
MSLLRALAVALAGILGACTSPPPALPTPSPTPESGVLEVTALLDLSGPRASIGSAQRNAMQLWVEQRQAAGARPPVRLTVVDLGGSDAKLFIELRRAAVEEPADAVIVGVPVEYGEALGRAIDVAALPVLFTLPLAVDPASRPGGRWAFALAPSLPALAAWWVRDATERGVLAPSLVLSDGRERTDPVAAAMDAELDRRGHDRITRIPLPADGSVPPVVRSGLSVLRSVYCTGLAATCAPVAREARSLGAPTLFYLSYLATTAELNDQRDLAARAVWPASRWILAESALTPAASARERFLQAYAERHGAAGMHAATAHDAMTLLATAAERSGSDDREPARAGLEAITIPLIAGTYSFDSRRHAGLDPADIVYVRWSGSGIVLALPLGPAIPLAPGGTPTATPRIAPPSPPAAKTPSPIPVPSVRPGPP